MFPLNWKTENCSCAEKARAWNGKFGNTSVWTKSKLRAEVLYGHRTFRVQYHPTPANNNFYSACLLLCTVFLSLFIQHITNASSGKTAVVLVLFASDSTMKKITKFLSFARDWNFLLNNNKCLLNDIIYYVCMIFRNTHFLFFVCVIMISIFNSNRIINI